MGEFKTFKEWADSIIQKSPLTPEESERILSQAKWIDEWLKSE